MSIVSFDLISAATQAAAPFSLGHAFKKGDVPAGSQVVGSIADLQVVPKNTWSDGSLKFAVVSGKASITAATPLAVTLSIGTPAAGTALTTADLKATGITAAIDAGAFGAASWSGTDWDAPFDRSTGTSHAAAPAWVSGPKMSSWIFRKQIGADAHLVGFLEVRLFAGGAVEILPWVENGYLKVAGPTNKSAIYSFTLGGTQRFSMLMDLKHHQRTALISGAMLSHWLGADPGVTPAHDKAYLQASELVPTYSVLYDAAVPYLSSTPSNHDSLVATFTPLARGNFKYDSDSMQSGGYQAPIGLLPTHDVAYLTGDSLPELRYGAVIRNGFASGRYPIHYRDETTQRPPAFSSYPTLVFASGGIKDTGASTNGNYTPAPTGGNGPQWDCSHSPSVGYMAYLLSGHFYFKEEAQFAVTANHFHVTDWVRGGGTGSAPIGNANRPGYTGASGLCTSMVQTRHGVWAFRALVQALAITPVDDPLRAELIACVEANCQFHDQIYLAQTNNQFGLVHSPEVYPDVATDRRMIPIWQHDFGTAAWGAALALDLPISTAAMSQMAAFFAWKAKSIVHRLGTSAGYRFERAGIYEYAVSPSATTDFLGGTGPWYADDAAAYAGTMVGSQLHTVVDGVLDFEYQPHVGMWGNLLPAISYAVQHGVAGAQEAYARLTSASNWSTLAAAFEEAPAWSIEPASITAPEESAPMGETLNIDVESRIPGALVIGNTGGGVLGKNLAGPVNGKAGYLYDDIDPVADADKEICGRITTWPTAGDLKVNEDGSYSFTNAPDGIYSFEYQLMVAYEPVGPLTTEELVVGGTQATAAWTEGADVISASATTNAGIAASIGWTEGADIISMDATASDGVAAAAEWTEGADVIAVSVTATTDPEDVFHVSPSCTVNFGGGTNRVNF